MWEFNIFDNARFQDPEHSRCIEVVDNNEPSNMGTYIA